MAIDNKSSSASTSRLAWAFFLDPTNPELIVRENKGVFPDEKGPNGVLTWPSWKAQAAALKVALASLQEVATSFDVLVLVRHFQSIAPSQCLAHSWLCILCQGSDGIGGSQVKGANHFARSKFERGRRLWCCSITDNESHQQQHHEISLGWRTDREGSDVAPSVAYASFH